MRLNTENKMPVAVMLAMLCSALVTSEVSAEDFSQWAQTPPMGWNSWDTYGSSVMESEVRSNAQFMSDHLKQFGWEYVVVDIRWYVNNPSSRHYTAFNQAEFNYNSDGIMTPSLNRFPSTTDGSFTQLAADIHGMDLKLGLHMMRGINRRFYDNVDKSKTIGDTQHTFGDLVVQNNGAFWLNDNYGLQQNAAAQAWYELMIGTYASWGMDYIKVDDLSAPNFRTGEVEMLRKAIDKVYNDTGHKVVLSTSPGATADIDNNFTLDPAIAGHVEDHANLWRITNDLWDTWDHVYPMFERAHNWTPHRAEGAWPDNDMLALGTLGIRAHDGYVGGAGVARDSRLTDDEEKTMLTLWSITKSPLMFGGDLTQTKQSMIDMLSNPEVLAVNQSSTNNRQLFRSQGKVAWVADAPDGGKYLAVFKLEETDFDALLGQASYVSPLITKDSPVRSVPIDVNIAGKDRLYLLVDDGDGPGGEQDDFGYDWAAWANMQLNGPDGETRLLTELPWSSATSGWQGPRIDQNNQGTGPIVIDGVEYPSGIGTHAVSIIEYQLPEGYTSLTGLAGLDDGGANQPNSFSSVRFAVAALDSQTADDTVDVDLAALEFTQGAQVRDLWSQEDLGAKQGVLSTKLASHGSALYLIKEAKIVGDFNGDGAVSMADYTLWRDNLGRPDTVLAPGSTTDGDGVIDAGDYEVWKSNFGAPPRASGAGNFDNRSAVPEPTSTILLPGAIVGGACVLRRRGIGQHPTV